MSNTSITNSFITRSNLNQGIKEAKGDETKLSSLFDNFAGIKDDLKADKYENEKVADTVKKNVENSKNNKKAAKRAENKANTIKKGASWGEYTITSGAKTSGNSYSFSIKDVNGKKGTVTVSYAEDGSKILSMKIGDKTVEKTYDKDGVLREKVTTNSKNKTVTTVDYDASGKINYERVENTETGAHVSSTFYDDNGQIARKTNYNEKGQIKETKDYEYDKNGNLVGILKTIKEGSPLYGKVDSIVATYSADGKTKTQTAYNHDGSETINSYTKNEKTGKWELYYTETRIFDKNGNLTEIGKYVDNFGVTHEDIVKYDKDGQITEKLFKSTEENGNVTVETRKYGKDQQITERIVTTTKENGDIETKKYDENRRITEKTTKVVNSDGSITEEIEKFNEKGKVIESTRKNSDGSTETTTRNRESGSKIIKYDSNGDGIPDKIEVQTPIKKGSATMNVVFYETPEEIKKFLESES